MKRFLVMMVTVMMVTLSANAQHREGDNTIQPRVGVTLSTMTNMDDSKMKVNVAFGVEFEHFFTDQFSAAAGVLYAIQGAKFDDDITMNLNYGLLPITANYYVLPGLALKAGVQLGFRVKAGVNHDGNKIDFDDYLEREFGSDVKMNTFDLAIPLGLSYEYSRVTLDARYNLGVTKLFSGMDEAVRNQVIVITLGYKF